MTTLTRREAGAGARPPADQPSGMPGTSRFATWRGSWGVALRMARRDLRRHKGRSAMVLLMVGLPTLLIVLGLTWYPTSMITGAERIPYEIGSGVALVDAPQPNQVVQLPETNNGSSTSDKAAVSVPGYDPQGTQTQQAAALSTFLHGTAILVEQFDVRVQQGDQQPRKTLLVADGRAGLGSRLALASGRWPANESEILVTQWGSRHGLPTTGTLTVLSGASTKTVAIVGIAKSSSGSSGSTDLVALTPLGAVTTYSPAQFILKRGTPVTWAEVLKLNGYGITVLSAEVLRHPPTNAELSPEARGWNDSSQVQSRVLIGAGGAILLLVTTLLVGPAFAVSAARQRRTLALAASNGAETRQLRHTVLAQAVVLGLLAAGAGLVLGILGVPLLTTVILPRFTDVTVGPLDIPWVQVLAVTAIAMLSAVIAALLPARRLGRLDIVGVMKGQNVSPRPSRLLPVIGLVVAAVGGFVLFTSVINRSREVPVVLGAIALIGGSLLLVPIALVTVARFSRSLPVALRMATRDAARQRTRSAPSVAAIVGGVAALTMLLIGLTSDTTQRAREYQPEDITGQGSVMLDRDSTLDSALPARSEAVRRTIARVAPAVGAALFSDVPQQWGHDPSLGTAAVAFVMWVPRGCTIAQTIAPTDGQPLPPDQTPKCARLGNMAQLNHAGVTTMPADVLASRLRLSSADADRLRAGAVVMMGANLPRAATFAAGTAEPDTETGMFSKNIKVTKQVTLPVIAVAPNRTNALALGNQYGVATTPEVARASGWPLQPAGFHLSDPSGTVSRADQDRIDAALGSSAYVYVERGFQRDDLLVMAIIVGLFTFLLLVVTFTSTALSLAEQQTDQATLAAVGATRGTRRAMAAAQSLAICGIGAVLGLAVGMVPGIAIAYPLTAQYSSCDDFTGACTDSAPTKAIIDIPWLWLAVVVVGIPLLAAALSALAVRRSPVVTRRAT